MYSCGPTVYSYAHIGNFRTFLTADLIVRVARALGWSTLYVSNITDVGHLTEDDVADARDESKEKRLANVRRGHQPEVCGEERHDRHVEGRRAHETADIEL